MDRIDNSRTVNIVLCAAGALFCIASGFISAPAGILDNESVSIVSTLPMPALLFLYIVPVILMLLACALVVIGRFDIPPLIAAVCGTILFAAIDIKLTSNYQMFSGVFINIIGVILIMSGVALQVMATETGPAKLSRKAAKKRNSADVPYERHHRPAYDDIYADSTAEFTTLNKNEAVIFTDTSDAETVEAELANAETANNENTDADDEAIIEKLLMVMNSSDYVGSKKDQKDATESDDTEFMRIIQEVALNAGAEESEGSAENEEVFDIEDLTNTLLTMLENEEQTLPAADTIKANMAAALETPNQVMADFYGGIEEIFLSD